MYDQDEIVLWFYCLSVGNETNQNRQWRTQGG